MRPIYDDDGALPVLCPVCQEPDGKHLLGCENDSVEIELAAVRRRVAASLTVDAVLEAARTNTSPTSVLTPTQVKRELARAFGRDVLVHDGKIRSRRENH